MRGTKEIPYDSIVAVQFKKPGIMTGFIQFSLRGGSEAKAGLGQAIYDENTVAFRFNSEAFAEARDLINARVERTKSPVVANVDVEQEIRAIASLRDDGLITEQEFQQKKAQLLGL